MMTMKREPHIYSISEFKQEMSRILSSRKEIYPSDDVFCGTIKGKDGFEEIRTHRGDKVLFPINFQYLFLFRGQNMEYVPCLPTLYRMNLDVYSQIVERMKYHLFEQLLYSHPIVTDFFQVHNYRVDVEGLAQHYGLSTAVLDFTSDLDVALFFATCKYNRNMDSYECYNDRKKHKAVLYVINPFIHGDITKTDDVVNLFENRITCIGLQPFARPGVQKGFAYHCTPGHQALQAIMYHIEFTTNESRKYFAKYKEGQKLWVHDELVSKTKLIKSQKCFSQEVFEQSAIEVMGYDSSFEEIAQELNRRGIVINNSLLQQNVCLSLEDRTHIIDRWYSGESKKFSSSLFHRETIRDGVKYNELDMEAIVHLCMLDIAASGLQFSSGWSRKRL